MTYCLGWKTETCAYLVADAATTGHRPLRTIRSSFGERHVSGVNGSVEEGALKIISAGSAAITFAGDASLGYSVVETFRIALAAGLRPRLALHSAVSSSIDPNDDLDLHILAAFVEDGEPHLVSFNRDGHRIFLDHETRELVQLGCLTATNHIVCQISDGFIQKITETKLEGAALLACALGLCQSYGIHHVLLDHGAGGTFVGAFVDASGFHWQPDTGYLLLAPSDGSSLSQGDAVFSFVRDNVLIVRSVLADGPPRIFLTSLGEPSALALERARTADEQCLDALRNQRFHYLVFLNISKPIVGVIEMGGRREHRHVVVYPLLPPASNGRAYMPHVSSSGTLSLSHWCPRSTQCA